MSLSSASISLSEDVFPLQPLNGEAVVARMTSVELQMPTDDGGVITIARNGIAWFTNYQLVYQFPNVRSLSPLMSF